MSLISLVKIPEDTVESTKQTILKSLELINNTWSKDAKNVVIKPNLCYYWDYSTGQTTDPKFVAALIELIREKISKNVKISIVESDASAMKCKHAFKMLGYDDLSQDYDVELVNLSEGKTDALKVTSGNQSFSLMVPRIIRDADLRINVPKIKYTIEKIKITCALKNIFGCNPYQKKFRYHSRLEEAIVAINKAMRFDLCVIDGNIVSGTQPRRLGLVMASIDPVAMDAAAAKIAGINPGAMRYLRLARKEGLGSTDFIPKGEPLEYFKARYPRKGVKRKLVGKAYTIAMRTPLAERLDL
jgi:uncharacterized protein (DUF362 family)